MIPVSSRLPLTPLIWTSLVLAAAVLLHVDQVPLWVTGVTFALIGWRLAANTRAVSLPGRLIRAVVALGLVVAVFFQFHTLSGLVPGTTLLTLMTSIKLLETHNRRDQYIVVGGCLFLLLAACLARQGLARAPLYLLDVWLSCAALASIGYSPGKGESAIAATSATSADAAIPVFDSRAAALLAARALLYSIPLAVLLFVFFPRLPGAFWSLPRTDDAETGLSDTMSPGSISQLISSYDIAFRAKFDGDAPPPQERYWRGPVLHDFDGYTWKRRLGATYRSDPLEHLGKTYRYRITLEPSQQNWWLSLDTVDQSPTSHTQLTYDYQLVDRDPVTEQTSYNAVSHTSTRATEPLSKLARQVETQWPQGRNPRTLQFARGLRSKVDSDGAYIDAVLQYFHANGFVYSLTPPLLDYNSVDDFLFNTHSGFCGHYASAFVSLMRAAGVPARVVTGYLGGEWNPVGGYFVIRQSDAHSWAEVWLEGHGWVRVDPTAVVEPDRLTRGMLDLLPNAGSAESRLLRASPGIVGLLQRWDALNTWWTDQVLKFDYRSQLNLLSRLGIHSPDLMMVAWIFGGILMTWLLWIAWQVGRSPLQARPDRLARAYERLCRKLARVGLPRSPTQGPLAYAGVVSHARPDLASRVRELLIRYADLRYGVPRADSRAEDVAGFERSVAQLSLERAPADPGGGARS
jgi:transglutaminase-like putative cysteine protease